MINAKLYTSISDTPMNVFIRCIIYSDFKALKKSKGFIKQSRLKQVWDVIFESYIEASGDESNQILFGSVRELSVLHSTIKLIDDHLEILKLGYNKSLADNLKKMGFSFRDIENKADYLKQIKSINSRAKTLVLQANKLQSQIDDFDKNKGSESIKEDDFIELFLMLSKHNGYRLEPKSTTVLEFVKAVKQMVSQVERENKRNG